MTDFCYRLEIGQPPFPHLTLIFFQLCHWWESKGTSNAGRADFHRVVSLGSHKKWSLRQGLLGTEVGTEGPGRMKKGRRKSQNKGCYQSNPLLSDWGFLPLGHSEELCRKYLRIAPHQGQEDGRIHPYAPLTH